MVVQWDVIVVVVGCLLILIGLVAALRPVKAGPDQVAKPGHTAKLGLLEVTSPGPGLALVVVGIFALLAPGLFPSAFDQAGPPPGTSAAPSAEPFSEPTGRPPPHDPAPEPSPTDAPPLPHALALPGFGFVDLDRGRVVDNPTGGGDVDLVVPGSLVPVAAAHLAITEDVGTAAACEVALSTYADTAIGYEDLQRGISFCALTDRQAFAGVVVEPWQDPNGPMDLHWQLWEQG